MRNIEKIKAEIERQRSLIEGLFIEGDNSFYDGQNDAYNHLLAFIDSLPDENNPEPYNPVYDEDYLNEKIAKATKSWEGVDVNKMLADCRGYEEKPSEDLEEAANKFAVSYDQGTCDGIAQECFIAGANYQRLKRLAEAAKSSSHLDAYIEGMRRSIEKQIGQLPPPPPGYYYAWELDTIRKEGQSFTAIARPLLKQINPEQ